jgi:DNA (cytosine-5)-methyltransferase 1
MGPPVVSLFSGAGGIDLGLERAGFTTRAAVEWERYACETLRQNRRFDGDFLGAAEILERDVRTVSGAELLRAAELRRGEAALLAGGPPCVTFSVAGRREGLTADTGRLFEDYVRLLRAVRPQGLIYENVKGLTSAIGSDGEPGGAFREIETAIAAEGYALSWRVINAADYGVPQQRERVIILGRRGRVPPSFPDPTHADPTRLGFGEHARKPWLTVRDAIGHLPPAAPAGGASVIPNHVARRHSLDTQAGYAATPPGQRNQRYKRDRLRWDRPSKVIRAQGKPKADGSGQKNSSHQSIHPEAHRQLTPRECALLQTFPENYWLPDTFVNGYRVMGDAVPPALSECLGLHMLQELGYAEDRDTAELAVCPSAV